MSTLPQPRLAVQPDEVVFTAFAEGREEALKEAYDRWSALVHTLALRALGNTADAADATQATFVSAWRAHDSYDPSRPLPAWLVGIAKRRIIDVQRSNGRHPRPVDEVPDTHMATDLDALADRLVVADALAELPIERRQVVELAYRGQLTHAEIAEQTGLPLGTVKSHLRRGLSMLRTRLEGL